MNDAPPATLPDPTTTATSEQSPGTDPRAKRNSGLFAFFKWFKPGSRESIADDSSRSSGSLESVASDKSSGTVASFRYVSPTAYQNKVIQEKQVPIIGPETDTYRARLKQRDKRRESDKNVTLRKKYNLFFNKETLLRPDKPLEEDENSKSLPLMTRAHIMEVEPQKAHRRTNSESSKVKRAGAYVHVKGKRKAPQPPGGGGKLSPEPSSTASLKRKKRVAPAPPPKDCGLEKDILANDYLKLDHGVLKPVKEDAARPKTPLENLQNPNVNALSPSSSRTSFVEAPVSPRPWYKRNSASKEMLAKKENKYEPIERLPVIQYVRNSTLDLLTLEEPPAEKDKKKQQDEKRKSGMSFLTNISELDREASEIVRNKAEYERTVGLKGEIPEFMKLKDVSNKAINPNDSWASPKRRSARDLIAKFNAITNVTKATVFGVSQKDKLLFGKQTSLDETKQRQEQLLESHKKRIEDIDKKKEDRFSPLMKSESASAIKLKEATPKSERKSWKCPKCINLENEYWRIICHVCSAIKPYFDDFSSSSKSESKGAEAIIAPSASVSHNNNSSVFERAKTQIGFSALASYNANNNNNNNKLKGDASKSASEEGGIKVDDSSKKEERERLKKMLIEMKNSLPKRKSNMLMKQNSRTSIIMENPAEDTTNKDDKKEKTQEEKVAEILIGTTQTIYENIKMRKTDNPRPVKVSSSAQTSAVVKKIVPESSLKKLIESHKQNNPYEPMKVQDFEDIYSDKNNAARIYANLAQSDELSLFFNVPKNCGDSKKNGRVFNHTDTIEINRLLRRLETAIAKGDLTQAAIFAKELAQLKVNCSVIRQKHQQGKNTSGFQIEMYVEDKVSHRGPFPIDVTDTQTVAELKQQISKEFEIPVEVQRWILGKELVIDESTTLKAHKITEGCAVFLYLVAPEKRPREFQKNNKTNPAQQNQPSTSTGLNQNLTNPQEPSANNSKLIATKLDQTITCPVNPKINSIAEAEPEKPSKLSVPDKAKVEAPKIVNVIPKASEPSPLLSNKTELVRIIPVQREAPAKTIGQTTASNPSPTTATSVTEIKVDIRPYTSRYQNRRDSNGLVRATSTKIEVLQAPAVVVANKRCQKEASVVLSSSNNKTEPLDVRLKPATALNASSTSTKVMIAPNSSNSDEILPSVISIYPNLSKLSPINNNKTSTTPPSIIALSSTPNQAKAIEENDADDSNTLKPKKEWECHLCTLLNPDSSNVCAVCATVRIKNTSLRRSNKKKPAPQPQKDQTYRQLVTLDSTDLVPNADAFECLVCFLEVARGDGVTLRECLHQFCKECLARTVEFADDAEVKCPFRDEEYSCNIALQDREIKALVSPALYEQHLAKSVAQAENKMEKTFHCKTPDCKGWCIFEDNVNEFRCPVCRKTNCLTCQAIHMGVNCKQYQDRMQDESSLNEDSKRTKDFLEGMVDKGEAIACPTCKVILMKKWGCDWLRCSMCKTEICWVTRGPRWGPGGKGDTSGGCQCGLNGVKCHPKCNYCH